MSPRPSPAPMTYRVLTEREVDGQRVRGGKRVPASEIQGLLVDEAERQPGVLITLVIEVAEWGPAARWRG